MRRVCRLFGLNAGGRRVAASFWLLDAPDSLRRQSRRNPDGTGLGWYDDHGRPQVRRQPAAAFRDPLFTDEAHEVRSATFVAHVRHASTGALTEANTHPFEQDGRLFAHNGVIGNVEALDRELGPQRALVLGDTDSERFFALITARIRDAGGDVAGGIAAAVDWIADELPVFSLNFVLIEEGELWALRYPEAHGLWLLERHAPGAAPFHAESAHTPLRIASQELGRKPSVIVASERLDSDPRWRELKPGELLHVDTELRVEARTLRDRPPAHQLRLEDMAPDAARSQQH